MNAFTKRYNRIAVTLLLIFWSALLRAQQVQSVEMADTLRQDGKIYTVVIGLVVVLTGVIAFLIVVDRKVTSLGKKD